jgi:hypothetical protein
VFGIMPSPSFPGIEIGLDPGDTLVLSSDGLIDHNPCIGNDDDLFAHGAFPVRHQRRCASQPRRTHHAVCLGARGRGSILGSSPSPRFE